MVFVTSGRRVSFDLSHNTVHVLPSFEECRDEAKRIRREEWQRKTLNEEMLSEDIIVEIQEDSCLYARSAEMPEKLSAVELKSCLKKKEALSEDPDNKRKKHPKKNNQKKRKRSYSKSTIDKVNMISVH
ncbi:hypothetical protein BY458DRAFT_513210 [Sporodiniella umbellata]|nr:hypothetical protein BY458DRAFT_513210 [Sporodiniella umbellata]